MGTLGRAQQIVDQLTAAGLRATTDPYVLSPPCILVPPPNLTYDLGCGATLNWQLIALAPASATADRNSWADLDALVDAAYQQLVVRGATLVSYVVNGRTYPAYVLELQESI